MPVPSIDPVAFGSGGADYTPNNSAGKPWTGLLVQALTEDLLYPRFDWTGGVVTAPAATDLATLVALSNEISAALVQATPAGARAFNVRNTNVTFTAGDAASEAEALAQIITEVNNLKAAFLATTSVNYTATITAADATDQATAITLINDIRDALSIP